MPESGTSEGFLSYARTRVRNIPQNDRYFIATMGVVIAGLLLPLLHNLGASALLAAHGLSFFWLSLILLAIAPVGLLSLACMLAILPFHHASAAQLSRYAVIGCFNVTLNAAIFNLLIIVSGISTGPVVAIFAVISFIIVVTQAFFWSAFWTFRNTPAANRKRQYTRFLSISSIIAAFNTGVIYVMVSMIGAPAGIPAPVWANIALLCTIFTGLLGNFIGYKFFVFAK